LVVHPGKGRRSFAWYAPKGPPPDAGALITPLLAPRHAAAGYYTTLPGVDPPQSLDRLVHRRKGCQRLCQAFGLLDVGAHVLEGLLAPALVARQPRQPQAPELAGQPVARRHQLRDVAAVFHLLAAENQ